MNKIKQVIYELSKEELIEAVKKYMKKNKIKLSKKCKIEFHSESYNDGFSDLFGNSSEPSYYTLCGAKITCDTRETKIKGIGTETKETTLEIDTNLIKKAVLKYMKHLGYNIKKAKIELFDNLHGPAVRITVSK